MVSVICCVYNALPLCRQSIEAAVQMQTAGVEYILVDQHSPDESVSPWLRDLWVTKSHDQNVRVVDPGKNLGCHAGWNRGYAHSTGEYVVKLDDDTVMKTENWADKLATVLLNAPEIAFIAADCNAKQANEHRILELPRAHTQVEVALNGVVGFSCVMFRRKDIEKWGPMCPGSHRFAGSPAMCKTKNDRLYGGEEEQYSWCARQEGRMIAYLPSVQCWHLDNTERDPDYAAWKYMYGYLGMANEDLVTWRKAGKHISAYAFMLKDMIGKPKESHNHVLMIDWSRRLAVIGNRSHLHLLEEVARTGAIDGNAVCMKECDKALAKLQERTR